jgi:exopolysaccharide production protein ExoZ
MRGIAAVIVILNHLADRELQDWPDFHWHLFHPFYLCGNLSVDLFFVFSGFVITTACFNDFGRPGKVLNFAIKRFYRIYPIYWVTCIPILAWSVLHHGKDWFGSLAALMFMPGYVNQINPVSWSLVHELVFYLVFAFALFLPVMMLPVILSIFAIVIAVHYFDPNSILPTWIYSPVVFSLRNLAFFMGVPIAFLARMNHGFWIRSSAVLAAVLVATTTVVTGLGHFDLVQAWPNRVIFLELPAACIIYSAVGLELKGTVWSARILQLLGDASYSIYLMHYMVILAAKPYYQYIVGDALRVAWTLSLFVVCMVLGLLTYLYVEAPMLRLFKEKTSKSKKRDSETKPEPAVPASLVGA